MPAGSPDGAAKKAMPALALGGRGPLGQAGAALSARGPRAGGGKSLLLKKPSIISRINALQDTSQSNANDMFAHQTWIQVTLAEQQGVLGRPPLEPEPPQETPARVPVSARAARLQEQAAEHAAEAHSQKWALETVKNFYSMPPGCFPQDIKAMEAIARREAEAREAEEQARLRAEVGEAPEEPAGAEDAASEKGMRYGTVDQMARGALSARLDSLERLCEKNIEGVKQSRAQVEQIRNLYRKEAQAIWATKRREEEERSLAFFDADQHAD